MYMEVVRMYKFTEDCMTGIAEIDEEHRQLFDMMNQAIQLLQEQEDITSETEGLIQSLLEYAAKHFSHEEDYMESIQDPELPRQKREHQAFREKMEEMSAAKTGATNGKAVMQELMEYLSRWLYHHILGSDILIGKLLTVQKQEDSEQTDAFAFTDKYRTGIPFVDEEHEKLFDIIRETNTLIYQELLHDKYDGIIHILKELKEYTIHHFQDEENYMESIGYEGIEAQKHAHLAFVEKLNEINLDDMDDNQQQYLEELVEFLLGWLSNHILKMDKRIPVSG